VGEPARRPSIIIIIGEPFLPTRVLTWGGLAQRWVQQAGRARILPLGVFVRALRGICYSSARAPDVPSRQLLAASRPAGAGSHLGPRGGLGAGCGGGAERAQAALDTAITAETAWHRRARRQRQQARAIIAVDRARRTIALHHGGGGSSNVSDLMASPLPPWTCGICGIADNWGNKPRCRNCNAYPPESHRLLVKGAGKGGKGGGGGGGGKASKGKGKGNVVGNYTYGNLGTFASRQMQLAKSAERARQAQAAYGSSAKQLLDARKRADELLELNKRLQRDLAEAKNNKALAKDDMDEDYGEGPEEPTEEERKTRMDKIRSGLPFLE
jgi:hypothetical protein